MSSSTSATSPSALGATSPSALGECVVCGKESSTRCGTCLQGGVTWMFFCSREHQKLIWNAHKRVCGGSFKWPALSEKEGKAMIELSTKPRSRSDVSSGTWSDAFEGIGGVDKDEAFKTSVLALSQERECLGSQTLLWYFRQNRFLREASPSIEDGQRLTYEGFYKVVASDPLGCLAHSLRLHWEDVQDHEGSSWYSDFHHKMLILIGVLGSFQFSKTNGHLVDFVQARYRLAHSVNQVIGFAFSAVYRSGETDEARKLFCEYLPCFLRDMGVKIVEEGTRLGDKWKMIMEGRRLVSTDFGIVAGSELRWPN